MAPRLPPELLERIARFCEPEAGFLLRVIIGYDAHNALLEAIPFPYASPTIENLWCAAILYDSAVLLRAVRGLPLSGENDPVTKTQLLLNAVNLDRPIAAKYIADEMFPGELGDRLILQELHPSRLDKYHHYPARVCASFFKCRPHLLVPRIHAYCRMLPSSVVERILADMEDRV